MRLDSFLQQSLFDGKLDPDRVVRLLCMLRKLRLSRPRADDTVWFLGERKCTARELMRSGRSLCVGLFEHFKLTHANMSPEKKLENFTYHLKPILLNIHLANPIDDDVLFQQLEDIQKEIDRTAKTLVDLFDPQVKKDNYHSVLFNVRDKVKTARNRQNSVYSCFG